METFKNKITFIITPIISFFIVTSCCNGPRVPEIYWLDEELLQYAFFKNGTKWIYQDSLSGNKDTVLVSSSDRKLYELSGASTSKKKCDVYDMNEVFSYHMFSTYYGKNYEIAGGSRCKLHEQPEKSACYSVTIMEENSDLIQYYLIWDPIIGNVEQQYNYKSTIENIYTSIVLNGKTFTEVIVVRNEFYDDYNPNIISKTERKYIAKNIGVIRIEILNDSLQVWNLIEEKIIQ